MQRLLSGYRQTPPHDAGMPDPFVQLDANDFGLDMGELVGWQNPDPPASAPARPAIPRRAQPAPDRNVNPVLVAEFNQMEWVPVTSSNLEYVAYVPGVGRLWVWFRRKAGSNARYHVYAYDHVPPAVYEGLMGAASHGVYFARNLKNTYAVTPIA
jgi:hypothetical protein